MAGSTADINTNYTANAADAATSNAATSNTAISNAASTSSSFATTTLATGYIAPVVEELKTLTSSDLQAIGWVLWAVILITLLGNVCSFYAVFDRRNFKVTTNNFVYHQAHKFEGRRAYQSNFLHLDLLLFI